jgi:UDP-glucose 4-epimerase
MVTGGAGFIGSNLVDQLVRSGCEVVVYDNFSTGQREFLRHVPATVEIVHGDLLDGTGLRAAMPGCDLVFHLAANADVRDGPTDPSRDLQQNTLGTSAVLESMRASGVTRIVFTSTAAIYGEPQVFPTPEDGPLPVQTSLYGASKLAGEAMIQAYVGAYGFSAGILRLASTVGERYSHGHIFDFCRALTADPANLLILGDGSQRKPYLYVGDCIDAIVGTAERLVRGARLQIVNVGSDDMLTVNESLDVICAELGLRPARTYSGGPRGWIGDSPRVHLDCSRLRATGWRPVVPIRAAITRTVRWLADNKWILRRRTEADAQTGEGLGGSSSDGRSANMRVTKS